ncbi:hypothetical protein Tco_1394415 [Tanacetum coccineum]
MKASGRSSSNLMIRSNGVDICHPGLSNLTLENGPFFENVINMVAPQLKNLTVEYWQGLHLISAPKLVSLRFKDYSYEPNKPDAHTIVDLLQQLHSVKYLTLNLEIFQVLSPLMELISYQPSPFVNLKSLKLLSPLMELISYQPSPFVNLKSLKEMRALKNAASAINCMTELGVMLEREKANIETNIAHLDRVMTPMECQEPNMHEQDKMQINKREIDCQIHSYWKDLSAQIEHGKSKTSSIVSKLCRIKELLTELPASRRSQIEKSFSRLCTEADIVMNAIMNSMKIQSDEKQSRLSIYFYEVAMAAKPSF